MRSAKEIMELYSKTTPGKWELDSGDIVAKDPDDEKSNKHVIPQTKYNSLFTVEAHEALLYWVDRAIKMEKLLREIIILLNYGGDQLSQVRDFKKWNQKTVDYLNGLGGGQG